VTAQVPRQQLNTWWCPRCGRHELNHQSWHVQAGTISERCSTTMIQVEYELGVDREFLELKAAEYS
jgi:hypothetical protein